MLIFMFSDSFLLINVLLFVTGAAEPIRQGW